MADDTGWDEVVRLLDALSQAGSRVWVAGGWGVDVLVGRQTREHGDLDLAIDADGLAAALASLAMLGYRIEVDWLPVRVALVGDGRVDLHPVVFDGHGDGVQAGFDGEVFHYPAEGLTVGTMDGRPVPCLAADLQLSFRQGYELRDVDHHDLALLHGLTGP